MHLGQGADRHSYVTHRAVLVVLLIWTGDPEIRTRAIDISVYRPLPDVAFVFFG